MQPPRYDDEVELLRIARTGGPVEPVGVAMKRLAHVTVHPEGSHLAFHAGRLASKIWSIDNLLPLLAAMDGEK